MKQQSAHGHASAEEDEDEDEDEDENEDELASDVETDGEQRTPEAQAELWMKRQDAHARAWGRCREVFFGATTLAFGISTAVLTMALADCQWVCGPTWNYATLSSLFGGWNCN